MDLAKPAGLIVNEILKLKENETLLIMRTASQGRISQALQDEATKVGAAVFEMVFQSKKFIGTWGLGISRIFGEFDAVISLGFATNQGVDLNKARTRAVSMPSIDDELFARAIDLDYNEMRKKAKKLKQVLEKAEKVHITSSSGTDLRLVVTNQKVKALDAAISANHRHVFLPEGEVAVVLNRKTANGVIVADFLGELGKAKTRIHVKNGAVHEVEGDNELAERLTKIQNAGVVSKFGIGLNKKTTLKSMIEAVTNNSTCNFVFGDNSQFSGRICSEVSLPCVVIKPDIMADGKKIMAGGQLLL
ncbi:MAG: aminopeptidase [DPANN group archaeon]|nr:aminopeptidase [DPANN group archaeon]